MYWRWSRCRTFCEELLMSNDIKFLVSACLAGVECRYDCKAKTKEHIKKLVDTGEAIAVCPEELGGLPTPRPPAEEKNGKIITNEGNDVTHEYDKGAKEAFKLISKHSIKEVYLKSKSPMCGIDEIYDGTHTGNLKKGDGVFAKLLRQLGIKLNKV